MWNARHPAAPIEIATVVEWQRERRLLKYSFLEPLTAHATALHVHSKILARHIAETYGYSRVSYLPFALQMTAEEVRSVVGMRRAKSKTSGTAIHVAMLGETEPTKGCSELVFAVKMLAIMGLDANLFFVGKSEEPYRGELLDNCRRLGISDRVHFLNYVTRQTYLEEMGRADVLVQLRYSLFGQVSGPLGDAVACGAPVVTTAELAYGTGLEKFCSVVPDQFSPLHIATAVRRVIGTPSPAPRPSKINPMAGYVKALLQATAAPGA
jgi:glycosyltransferase involved in cell wall biosynthesis